MEFTPRPVLGLGLATFVLAIFGMAILLLFARSLLVGTPGLQAADIAVALGAAVVIPLIGQQALVATQFQRIAAPTG